MSTQLTKQDENRAITANQFRHQTTSTAHSLLKAWVGEERAQEACGRIATAISVAAQCSKNPEEFYLCTPASVGAVIAMSALTGIMVGTGPTALAYAIPRRARRGDKHPNLTYQLSHRGINALAARAGYIMVPVPVGHDDKVSVDISGDVQFEYQDIDNPPTSDEEMRGIVVVVKSTDTGTVLMRRWVAKKLIHQRRATSDSFVYAEKPGNEWAKASSPWHVWPVEQAMKTAMHYAIARGWVVIDDTTSIRALSLDAEQDGHTGAHDGFFGITDAGSKPSQAIEGTVSGGSETSDEPDEDIDTIEDQSARVREQYLFSAGNSTKVGVLRSLIADATRDPLLTDLDRDIVLKDLREKVALCEEVAS